MFIAALTGLAVFGGMLAPPVTIDVPLRTVKLDRKSNPYLGQRLVGISPGTQALKGYAIPKQMGVTHSALMFLAEGPVAVAAAKDAKETRFAKVWIDFNQNKKFESQELAVYSGKDDVLIGYDFYEFKRKPDGLKGKVNTAVIGSEVQVIGLVPTAALEGSFELGGQKTSVKAIDTNFDGLCGTAGREGNDLLICLGDQVNVYGSFGQMFALADGRYYAASMAKNGRTLSLVRDQTPVGTLAVDGGELTVIQLSSPKGNFVPRTAKGEATIPAGEYVFAYGSFSMTGKDGVKYQISFNSEVPIKLKVAADEKTLIRFGEGLRLALRASNAGASRQFDLNVSDKNGFKVSGIYKLLPGSREMPKEPELAIYGPDGSLVDKLTFHYG